MLCKNAVLKNFAKFTRKHLCMVSITTSPPPSKKKLSGARGGEGLNIFKLLFSWGVIYFFGGVTLNANYYIISNEQMRIKQKEMKNNFFHILSSSSNLSNFQPLSLLRPRLTFNIILYFYIRFRFRFIRTY